MSAETTRELLADVDNSQTWPTLCQAILDQIIVKQGTFLGELSESIKAEKIENSHSLLFSGYCKL